MQQMKINTATVGRKNGRAEQMIGIYKHRPKHNKIGFSPILMKENQCNEQRKNQMQKVMRHRSERKNL
jgi:hypothetical protein